MKNTIKDKFLFRYVFYTILGWFLFILINVIQFFIFMPIVFIYSLLFDRQRKSFVYLTKFFSNMFFILFFVERLKYDNNGIKAPKKGEKRIYVINHASQYDVILMYLLPGPIKFLFKEKWAKLPLIGWMATMAGNVILKDDTKAAESAMVFRKSAELLKQGIPFVIYPEGTRSRNGKLGNFFHGTFKLALDGEANIVPVVFDSWNTIRPGGLWIRDVKCSIKILDTIKYEEFSHLSYVRLSNLVRSRMMEGLINIRDERRKTEKKYYRKDEIFEKIDNEMKQELIELNELIEKKGIALNKLS
jgi:1-acyl-sn-glycerol-3-phosphate acyltransferase